MNDRGNNGEVVDEPEETMAFQSLKKSGRSNSIRISYGSPSMRSMKESMIKKTTTTSTPNISNTLRWTTNGSSLLSVFLFSGIIFGWSALKLILVREGQYDELCNDDEGCVPQTNKFNQIFTLAQFFLSFASLPVGFFLDYASKTLHFLIAAVAEIAGLVLFAISDSKEYERDYFVLAYSLMALGGCMTMLGAFPASFLLPKYQAGILATVSCLFDASSLVFAVFYRLYLINDYIFSRLRLFLSFGGVALVIYLSLAFSWNSLEALDWKKVIEEEEEDATENDDKQGEEGASERGDDKLDPHVERIRRIGMHDRSLLEQLSSFDFVVVLTFAAVHMLRCNFYIEIVNELLEFYGDEDATFASMFSFVLPSGIVFVPVIESTIRHWGVVRTLHLTNAIGVVFGALLLIPSLYVQAVNFFIFTLFRAFLYAVLNTFIAITFGVSTMGRVIGSTFTTAAVVTLVQYPAASLALSRYEGDFKVVNTIMLSLCLLPIILGIIYQRESTSMMMTKKGTVGFSGETQPLL